MTHLSVVPKNLGKEAIKSNSCGDAKASDIHRAENLLMGSILLVLSWCGGSVGDTRKLQRGAEDRRHPARDSLASNGIQVT